jgi:hypothetical protein
MKHGRLMAAFLRAESLTLALSEAMHDDDLIGSPGMHMTPIIATLPRIRKRSL